MSPRSRFDAVLFDLLTGLVDSWSLWNSVAGGSEDGRRWRAAYLRRTYGAGAYRPYEEMVAEAAAEEGLDPALAGRLAARYEEVRPWPEVQEVLGAYQGRLPLGIVTNCSEMLAAKAVAAIGIDFAVVLTAERAGFYKPHPRPYRLALDGLGVPAQRCLFVAGSAYDLFGTAALGLATFWHDRIGMTPPAGAPEPLLRARTLHPLRELVPSAAD